MDQTSTDEPEQDADTPAPTDAPTDAPVDTLADIGPVAVAASPVTPSRGAGAGSMIVGGVLAAAIGAGAVLAFLPEGWRPAETGALEQRLIRLENTVTSAANEAPLSAADITQALAPVSARLSALENAAAPDLAPLAARIATLEAAALDMPALNAALTAALTAALAPLQARLALIEADTGAQARTAVDAALADARAEAQAQANALSTREQDIAAAQARIAARAALAELVAAAESGTPQPGALAVLDEVPAALAPFGDGLVTLGALQDTFASAARVALDAVAPPPDAPLSDRVLTFLRNQTGARSLAPRAGDDPDAILSRAEAALQRGDLPAALAELDALSGPPAQAMTAWRARVEQRLAALEALHRLQQQFTGNEG